MKTLCSRLILASLLGMSAVGRLPAAAPQTEKPNKPEPRVTVVFERAEEFKDAQQDSIGTDKGRESVLSLLKEFLETRGTELLPPDWKLALTFTDIDLAGEYEPWRTPPWTDIRIVKDIYPPRFDFSYRLTDAQGQVVREDKVMLRDLTFMMRVTMDRQDSLHFEKDMLEEWLRTLLKTVKAKP